MPMSNAVHDVLKEKLADAKITIGDDEVSLFDFVVGLQDQSDYAEKTKKINEELKAEKTSIKEKHDALEAELSKKATQVQELQKGLMSEEDKQKLEELKKTGGISPEIQAQLNKNAEDLKVAMEQINSLTESNKAEQAATREAKLSAQQEQLKTSVLTALQEKGIVGENARVAWNDIRAEGLASITENDGNISHNFVIKKDGKPLTANCAELAEHYASSHEFLVKSSGNGGSGLDHLGGRAAETVPEGATLQDLREQAQNEMFMTK